MKLAEIAESDDVRDWQRLQQPQLDRIVATRKAKLRRTGSRPPQLGVCCAMPSHADVALLALSQLYQDMGTTRRARCAP